MAGKIFFNYRRRDDPGFTTALYQRLESEFSADDLFMDVEGRIKPGDDFIEILSRQVAESDVVLAIIGLRWAEILRVRETDDQDFVQIELHAALAQGKRVIPVLVGGAQMPDRATLPEKIRALSRLHAVVLRPERFKADCAALVVTLKEALAQAEAAASGVDAAGNDGFDKLFGAAARTWREVAVMRAIAKYLLQARFHFSQAMMEEALSRNQNVAAELLALFNVRFDPKTENRRELRAKINARIEDSLMEVLSHDHDRILGRFRNVIQSILRTNAFQGERLATISFKIDSRNVEGLPRPCPLVEIFVCSPEVEGVHLRFGRVARGGIRWSDRREDYRTETLGLAKALMVKNVVIVPVAAKGGFYPKKLRTHSRDAIISGGIVAYRTFIRSLLALTDNVAQDGKVIPPKDVVRYDGDDPYLVVAADKGTATFSDIANGISREHGFWLGDAFASGGSTGYDLKRMGITARGAWAAVQRHFREMDRDLQNTTFTAVGIGDMSGDVFGNGALMSNKMQLVAAFDHRHIFLDPAPDVDASFAERQRMFGLPRSSWEDYDQSKISRGGGVFSRSISQIPLSGEVKALTGLTSDLVEPAELMRAILKADVDLLWFGGVGTFIRATGEVDDDVGDRANNANRITSADLRAKVLAEGANLGITQAGRVEAGARGVRLNTDAIDNVAGVNASDFEVNIKLCLVQAIASGRLSPDQRDTLITSMTEEVVFGCVACIHQQSLAISLSQHRGTADISLQAALLLQLETRGAIDRYIESMPSNEAMKKLEASSIRLTRPELAVLLAYAKVELKRDLAQSSVLDDPFLSGVLVAYFPRLMRQKFRLDIEAHPLRREIISTVLANTVVDRGGPTVLVEIQEKTGHKAPNVACAFMIVNAIYDLDELWARIDALDGRVQAAAQLEIYAIVQSFLRRQVGILVSRLRLEKGLSHYAAILRDGIDAYRVALSGTVAEGRARTIESAAQRFVEFGIPSDLAKAVMTLDTLANGVSIAFLAERTGYQVAQISSVYSHVGEFFSLRSLEDAAWAENASNQFERSNVGAVSALLANVHQSVTECAVRAGAVSMADIIEWFEVCGPLAAVAKLKVEETIVDGRMTLARLSLAAIQVVQLREAIVEGLQYHYAK